jgi:hypothetical protein
MSEPRTYVRVGPAGHTVGFTIMECPLGLIRQTVFQMGGEGAKQFVKDTQSLPDLTVVILNESTGEMMVKRYGLDGYYVFDKLPEKGGKQIPKA